MKKKLFQVHHFATNKSEKYTNQFQKISKKYDLDLDAGWNKKGCVIRETSKCIP
ncbi:AHH domain-containing protein [Bacillus toyonensis]